MTGTNKREHDKLISEAHAKGWSVIEPSGRGYPKIRCPCGRMQETVHYTPSNPNYWKNKRAYLARGGLDGRCDCWNAEDR